MKVEVIRVLPVIASIALLFSISVLPVSAEEVTFVTTGSFCAGSGPCAPGQNSVAIGNYPNETFLEAEPVTTTVAGNVIGAPLINILIASIGSSGPGSGSFTLFIKQIAPSPGTVSITGALTGSYSVGSDTAKIDFGKDTVVIGGVLYRVDPGPFPYPTIGPPTRIETLTVDVAALPEPTFLWLTGLGFACLAVALFRRNKARLGI